MAVAADHHHAGAHEPLFVHEDVLDALIRVVGPIEGVDSEMTAVGFECFRLNELAWL